MAMDITACCSMSSGTMPNLGIRPSRPWRLIGYDPSLKELWPYDPGRRHKPSCQRQAYTRVLTVCCSVTERN